MNLHNKKGFSLVEILLVIAIIGILTIIVLPRLNNARKSAQLAKGKIEMKQIQDMISLAQSESENPLIFALNSTPNVSDWQWIYHRCQDFLTANPTLTLKDVPDTHQCFIDWKESLNYVVTASKGTVSNLSGFKRDPWGSPYLLDLNEGEEPTPGEKCRPSVLFSAGPDGLIQTSIPNIRNLDGTFHVTFGGDDFGFVIPYYNDECPNITLI